MTRIDLGWCNISKLPGSPYCFSNELFESKKTWN